MKATLLAAITVFIDFVGFGVIIPISTFYAEGFGASPLEITLLFSVYTMAQFIFSPIWGRLSDREGRKNFRLNWRIYLLFNLRFCYFIMVTFSG